MGSLVLDRTSATPVCDQIAQAFRWRIGTGILRAGEMLPESRAAASRWGVEPQDVDQAYAALTRAGWTVHLDEGGVQVASVQPPEPVTGGDEMDGWLDEVLMIAGQRFGHSPAMLANLILARQPSEWR